jgi:3-deoxy-D-manno-octulosonate 8-phosphate phosphatase (KDO 8-P phosphatase)
LIQTTKGKVPAVDSIRKKLKLTWDEICFIGDDLVDLAVMQKVGIAIAPATACAEAIDVAHHVTKAGGGNGAVRELVEKILKAQGKWAKVLSEIAQ